MIVKRFAKENYLQLPENPGIYRFLNQDETIIYVGKAKNLKKRVASYFTKSQDNRKTYYLVKEIFKIEFVIVDSEFDALLLENNLIKENQPKYNILLKDDKSFPSILVTSERFPRIFSTRRLIQGQGEYFGPYTNVKAMNGVLDLIRKLYTIRTCKYNLSDENIRKNKFKVCLEYHIGNCMGPCEGLQTEDDYLSDIQSAKLILKGSIGIVARTFKEKMNEAAREMKYELAESFKHKLDLLEKFQSKSLVVSPKIGEIDVFTINVASSKKHFVNFIKIEQGRIVQSETVELTKKLDESVEDLLRYSIFELRLKYKSKSPVIATNIEIESWEGVEIIQPKIGDKKKLIDLSLRNAQLYRKEKIKPLSTTNNILHELKDDLKLLKVPNHIECFDNSNIQGSNPVASMVCFREGRPSKKDYRKFNIKTVEGPDDFSSMYEVVKRRYLRQIIENNSLPDLIIIDGGKGQLNAATKALKELEIYGEIPIIGIAKRLEEIYFPEDQIPIHISKKSAALKLIQKIRDEAHRFAITFHRQKRSSSALRSSLSEIKGVGPKTAQKLLNEFKTIKRIKEANIEDLIKSIGSAKTNIIIENIKKGLF